MEQCPQFNACSNSHVRLCLQILTGFLIYDWIEQPKKQEIIKEVISLLEQKVLVPHSGQLYLSLIQW